MLARQRTVSSQSEPIMKQEFHLILQIEDFTEDAADALFQVGFDDSHLVRRDGRVCIIIDDRDTTDLDTTVRTAVQQAQQAGMVVCRVEIPEVERINSELAAASA